MNWIKQFWAFGLCLSSLAWGDCGLQTLTQAPTFAPIKSGLYDVYASDLLGKKGERVSVQDLLPTVTVTNKAFVTPHWAETIDWDAYQQTGAGPGFLTVYFDNHHRLCRIERRDFTPEFYEQRPDLRSQRDLQEILNFRKALRSAKDSEMKLEELVWFDYAPAGQLLAAQRFTLDETNQFILNTRRCFYYSQRGDLLGMDERESSCPDQTPADLIPRYIYSAPGQMVRAIQAHFNVGLTSDNAEPKSSLEVSVYDETGEIARYIPDENQRIYRMPKRDWEVKDRFERAPNNGVVTEQWNLQLFASTNWPHKYSPWAIQEKLAFDDAAELAPDNWKKPLLKGKTDGQGLLNLKSAQQLLLWEAIKRSPGSFFLRFGIGLSAALRLYPQVEDAVWADCLKLDQAQNNLCR